MLSWNDLSLKIPNKNKLIKKKHVDILHRTSGSLNFGEMLVIMGESGSGKTSFLNEILGKIPNKSVTTGEILYNNKKRKLSDWRNLCKMTDQNEILDEKYTVLETLCFIGRIYGIKGDIRKRALKLLSDLFIDNIAHNQIKSISGGERKRVTVLMSLMTDAKIVILDEPTSGLDTKNAENLLKCLRKVADEEKKMFLISLHQPGNRLLRYFDKVMLISHGKVVYLDSYKNLYDTLKKYEFKITDDISVHENISDAIDSCHIYEEIQIQEKKINKMYEDLIKKTKSIETKPIHSSPFFISLPNWYQIYIYFMKIVYKKLGSSLFYISFIGKLFFSIILLNYNKFFDINSIFDINGNPLNNNFISSIFGDDVASKYSLLFTTLNMDIIPYFVAEKKLVLSEIRNLYYTPTTYFISNFIFELITSLLQFVFLEASLYYNNLVNKNMIRKIIVLTIGNTIRSYLFFLLFREANIISIMFFLSNALYFYLKTRKNMIKMLSNYKLIKMLPIKIDSVKSIFQTDNNYFNILHLLSYLDPIYIILDTYSILENNGFESYFIKYFKLDRILNNTNIIITFFYGITMFLCFFIIYLLSNVNYRVKMRLNLGIE